MAVSRCWLIRLGVRYRQRLIHSIKIHHRTLSTSCFQSETTSHANRLCCTKCNKIRNLNIPSLSVLERRFKNTFEQRYIHTTCIRKENIEDSYDSKQEFSLRKAELDMEYLCDQKNLEEIEANIANRKGVGDIQKLVICYFHGHISEVIIRNSLFMLHPILKMQLLQKAVLCQNVPVSFLIKCNTILRIEPCYT